MNDWRCIENGGEMYINVSDVMLEIERLKSQLASAREVIESAKNEMLELNKDPLGNHYFDSCNESIEWLKQNNEVEVE